jgi:hypothetical protein
MISLDFRPQWMFLVELMSQVKSEPFGPGYMIYFLSRAERQPQAFLAVWVLNPRPSNLDPQVFCALWMLFASFFAFLGSQVKTYPDLLSDFQGTERRSDF